MSQRIDSRPFSGRTDLDAMTALAWQRPADHLHTVDLPYRFSSWAMENPDCIGLWHDARDNLVGWAVMQTPFWTIDYVVSPDADPGLHTHIVRWADERAKALLGTRHGRPIWFINAFADQRRRIEELEALGFVSQADVGENSWTKVLLRHPLAHPVAPPALPDGFVLRPLHGLSEVDDYVEMHRRVFNSTSMTGRWRADTLSQPAYRPDLDLVAVAPDGQLAAFCVCWLKTLPDGHPWGQIEPLGVDEDYRTLGLGRAILTEGLRRLQAQGARTILVETDNDRDEAFMLYTSVGFQGWRDVLVFRKDYAPFD